MRKSRYIAILIFFIWAQVYGRIPLNSGAQYEILNNSIVSVEQSISEDNSELVRNDEVYVPLPRDNHTYPLSFVERITNAVVSVWEYLSDSFLFRTLFQVLAGELDYWDEDDALAEIDAIMHFR